MSSPSGGVTDDNHAPWCIAAPASPTPSQQTTLANFLAANTINGQPPPVCPVVLQGHVVDANSTSGTPEMNAFALRGAINAGFAVFAYLDLVSKGQASTARFDECNLVPPSP